MKAHLLLPFLVFLFFLSCEKENNEQSSFTYHAEVIGRNTDCGVYAIRFVSDLNKVKEIAGESPEGIYIAKNLPVELQQPGINIILEIRSIKDTELGLCTTMGPAYPWLYVIRAKKAED